MIAGFWLKLYIQRTSTPLPQAASRRQAVILSFSIHARLSSSNVSGLTGGWIKSSGAAMKLLKFLKRYDGTLHSETTCGSCRFSMAESGLSSKNDMRVKRYFAPHLISTNYFAAKAAPVILKHSESADLLRKSLLPHVLRVPRSFTHLWASSCEFRPFDPDIIKILCFSRSCKPHVVLSNCIYLKYTPFKCVVKYLLFLSFRSFVHNTLLSEALP